MKLPKLQSIIDNPLIPNSMVVPVMHTQPSPSFKVEEQKSKKKKKKKAQKEENLPQTGIDQPFLKKRPTFIAFSPEPEPIHHCPSRLISESKSKESSYVGRVIYECQRAEKAAGSIRLTIDADTQSKYFDKLQPYYSLRSHSDTTLIFESRFESGNLCRAT